MQRILVADLPFFASIQSRQNFLNLVVVKWNLRFLYRLQGRTQRGELVILFTQSKQVYPK